MELKQLIKKLQIEMNKAGESLSLDGDFGPKTQAASDRFDFSITASKKAVQTPVLDEPHFSDIFLRAPWLKKASGLLGMDERMTSLNAILAPHWAMVGLHGFKDLIGSGHAWCSLFADWAMVQAGLKGTGSAGAASWRTWGKSCPYWFGAALGIRHASGGGHITFFLYWVDEQNSLAACFGGNQGDKVCISVYNLSGNHNGHDEVINGPRWPIGFPDGQIVAKKLAMSAFNGSLEAASSTT